MIDLFLLGMFLVILFPSRITKQKQNVSYNFTTTVKGILALNVVLCHLSFYFSNSHLLPLFLKIGEASVGVFFFLSGYGLTKNYVTKDDYYIGFISKRISKVVIPYLIISAIYWFYYYLNGDFYGLKKIFDDLLVGEPLVIYSWYIIDIIFLYCFYYLFMSIIKKRVVLFLLANSIITIIFGFLLYLLNYSWFWYSSLHMYVIGTLWPVFEDTINKHIDRNYAFVLLLSMIGIGVTLCLNNDGLSVALLEVFYLMIILLFNLKFEIANPVLYFLGKISFEMYLFHGLIIKAYRYYVNDNETFPHLFMIIIITIVISYLFNIFYRSIRKQKQNSTKKA